MGLPCNHHIPQSIIMNTAVAFLCICVAFAVAAPQKRGLIQDTTSLLKCEGMLHEEGCRMCCSATVWTWDAEKAVCSAACNLLPNKADYDKTTLIPYSTYAPPTGRV